MPGLSRPGAAGFCPRVVSWNADSGFVHKGFRRRRKLRFIAKLLRRCDVLLLQETNMRAAEAAAFRSWLIPRGFRVFFTFATDSKRLGGAICVRESWARPYTVSHHELVQSYSHLTAFSVEGEVVGLVGNLYFDSHAAPELRNSQIRQEQPR